MISWNPKPVHYERTCRLIYIKLCTSAGCSTVHKVTPKTKCLFVRKYLDFGEKKLWPKDEVHSVFRLEAQKQRSLDNVMFNMAANELNDPIEEVNNEHVWSYLGVPRIVVLVFGRIVLLWICLLYTSPSPRDLSTSRMPSSA